MGIFGSRKARQVGPDQALPGRTQPMPVAARHVVLGSPLAPPYPAGTEVAEFALGCFWGAEKTFWQTPGVVSTSVGYEGGYTPNPTYEEVCSGLTGHAETVRVVFDPTRVSYENLLKVFWESHDPTQGMRQGNDARPAAFPAWARAKYPLESEAEAAFLAGAALARLDAVVRENPPWAGVFRQRRALSAAAASVACAGRAEDKAALRDAFHLRRPGADPGPAGKLCSPGGNVPPARWGIGGNLSTPPSRRWASR